MTTVVSVAQGGTGANSATSARTNLGAAPLAAYDAANNAYAAANTASSTGGGGYDQANAAYAQANAAYLQANNAYLAANNSNLKLGGVVTGTLNVTQDIIVGGNVYLQGNTTYINVATYQVNDPLMYIAANNNLTDSVDIGFIGAKNTSGTYSHTGLARDATDGKYKLFDGLPEEGHIGNVINFANTYLATLVANVEANTLSVVNGVSGNVNFDSGTLFVDSVGNAVGIGTTIPSAKLHINDSGKAIQLDSGNDNSGTGIFFAGSSTAKNWFIGNQYNVSNSFEITPTVSAGSTTIGTNPALLVTGDYQVGIGTTPSAELHIYKSTGPTINLQAGSNGTKGLKIIKGDSGTAYINNIDAQDLVLATNNTNRVIITGDGLVGINTSTISERLTITGNIKLTTGSIVYVENPAGGRTGALFTDSTGTELRSYNGAGEPLTLNAPDSTAYMAFRTAGVERARILSGGNVGIGTTAPEFLLDVVGSSGNTWARVISGSGTTSGGFIVGNNDGGTENYGRLFWNNANNDLILSQEYTSGNLVFRTNTTERMRLDSSGNLFLNAFSGRGGGSTGYLFKLNPGKVYFELMANNTTSTSDILFTDGASGAYGIVGYDHSNDSLKIYTNSTWRMTVDSSGNVGIGTTNPGSKLHILDSSGPVFRMVRTSNRFDIEADNNAMGLVSRDSATANAYFSGFTGVGIGTTSPSGLWSGDERVLHLSSSGGTAAGIRISSVNATAEFFSSAGSVVWGLYSNSSAPFTIYTNASERLRITSGGNIGIGTTSSDYAKVHIRESGITAAAISTGWPAYNAETATQSKYVLHLDAGSNGSTTTSGYGPSAVLLIGNYYDSRGIITMLGAGGGSPSDGGTGYGKDLMVKAGNSDNGNGYIGGRLFLAGGSGYSGGAYGTNFGSIIMQSQGGNVCIGTTSTISTYAHLHIRGSQKGVAIQNSDSGYYRAIYVSSTNLYFYNGTNEGYLNDSGAWTNASDIRIKKDITEIKYGLNTVLNAQPRSYRMIDSDKECIGFVAQEMLDVVPEVVSGDLNDPDRKLGLDYGSLVAVAFKAIQELKAELDAAKLRITELENN